MRQPRGVDPRNAPGPLSGVCARRLIRRTNDRQPITANSPPTATGGGVQGRSEYTHTSGWRDEK
jgi:hypothetical protein